METMWLLIVFTFATRSFASLRLGRPKVENILTSKSAPSSENGSWTDLGRSSPSLIENGSAREPLTPTELGGSELAEDHVSPETLHESSEVLNNGKMIILDRLGQGTFGSVYMCLDTVSDDYCVVAVKVNQPTKEALQIAIREERILTDLKERALISLSLGRHAVVEFLGGFLDTTDRYCLTFEPLGMSLLALLEQNNFVGFHTHDIALILRSCSEALEFIHEAGYIHADLKPENICIVTDSFYACAPPDRYREVAPDSYHRAVLEGHAAATVKVVDFGSALPVDGQKPDTVVTVGYRAPEIIQRQPYSKPIDMWALACIGGELYLGNQSLFKTGKFHTEEGVMQSIRARLGDPGAEVRQPSLREQFGSEPRLLQFLESLLKMDPAERSTATDVLRSAWFCQ